VLRGAVQCAGDVDDPSRAPAHGFTGADSDVAKGAAMKSVAMKSAAMVHKLQPSCEIKVEPLQDRRQPVRNGAALAAAHNAPGLVNQGHILIERNHRRNRRSGSDPASRTVGLCAYNNGTSATAEDEAGGGTIPGPYMGLGLRRMECEGEPINMSACPQLVRVDRVDRWTRWVSRLSAAMLAKVDFGR